nr:MAG TPA: hypothetical protein [Caudoviricetes sp.]
MSIEIIARERHRKLFSGRIWRWVCYWLECLH